MGNDGSEDIILRKESLGVGGGEESGGSKSIINQYK